MLQLIERIPGTGQAAPGGRHRATGDQLEVKELHAEAAALKEAVTDHTLENRLLKSITGARTAVMRYAAAPIL